MLHRAQRGGASANVGRVPSPSPSARASDCDARSPSGAPAPSSSSTCTTDAAFTKCVPDGVMSTKKLTPRAALAAVAAVA